LALLDNTGNMMSAVAEIDPPLLPAPPPTWIQGVVALDGTRKMRLALGLVLVIAIAIAGLVYGRQADYRVLYANLSDKDGGAILAQLSQMNIPYKHADGGSAILVPSDRVNDLRMRLASQGLPKGSVGGFEMMEANRFGMTQFQERLTFQRGLEGELTRSIQALSSVQGARVHLALPNQNGFFREQQKASASVLLSLHPGRMLDRAQIAGIVHLVSSSIPEMKPEAVSVLDDSGKLLSQSPDGANGAGNGGAVDVQQLQYVQQLEQAYAKRIMDILEPVVGRQNVRAQVSAEVDFSQTESTSETHRPNQGAEPAAVRSLQVLEAGANANNGNLPGVPGAVSNQPPVSPTASINGGTPTLTAGAANGGGAAGTAPGSKKEMITNYEVDKTTRVVRGATAVIKRVNAAVVLNNPTTEEKGKPVTKPMTPQQLEQMTALVRESIGFSKDRGDSVNVVNAAFVVEKVDTSETPLWKQADVIDAARSYAWPVAALIFAFLVMQKMVKPVLTVVNAKPELLTEAGNETGGKTGTQLNAIESDDPQRPDMLALGSDKPVEITPEELRLEEARALTRANPQAVANIMKSWVNGEPAA
jgi:flagellar M-ring protein FliF